MYGRLVRLRLRWYSRTSGELVLRHWQWLVLACLIVPGPPVVSIFLYAAALLAASVSTALSPAQHFLVAIVIDLAAVLWILPQRHALSGGPFMRYADALPLPRGVRLGVEATLLAAANSRCWYRPALRWRMFCRHSAIPTHHAASWSCSPWRQSRSRPS